MNKERAKHSMRDDVLIFRPFMVILCALWLTAGSQPLFAVSVSQVDRTSGWYPAGTNLTVTATPGLYSQFAGWSGDTNVSSIAGQQISFDVTGPRTITAVFKAGVTVEGAVPYSWLGAVNQAWTNDFESAATNDWDNDGFTTDQEYWSGTDPMSSNSFLRICAVSLVGANIQLSSVHARVDTNIPPIRVLMSTNLMSGSWTDAGGLDPVDGTNTWSAVMQPRAFYCLSVTNAP
jgi:hypothetical protein